MTIKMLVSQITLTFLLWSALGSQLHAEPAELQLERVVGIFRHGIRAPLPGEAPVIAGLPAWPQWDTSPGELTDRGYRGAQIMAAYLRHEWLRNGLLKQGCNSAQDAQHDIRVYANSLPRTLKSGEAMLGQLALECGGSVEHQAVGTLDPLFNSIATGAVSFDATTARAQLEREASPVVLFQRHHRVFQLLQRLLGCEQLKSGCDLRGQFGLPAVTINHNGVRVGGAIEAGAGAAQVLMLQYLQGMPMANFGAGRIDHATLEQLSVLHALPFELQARPAYLATRIAAPLLQEISAILQATAAPNVTLFIGHDNHLSALASVLGFEFKAPGYARNDPAVGSGLIFELLRSTLTGQRYVRIRYIAQTPRQLRTLVELNDVERPYEVTLTMARCASGSKSRCNLNDFVHLAKLTGDAAQLNMQSVSK